MNEAVIILSILGVMVIVVLIGKSWLEAYEQSMLEGEQEIEEFDTNGSDWEDTQR